MTSITNTEAHILSRFAGCEIGTVLTVDTIAAHKPTGTRKASGPAIVSRLKQLMDDGDDIPGLKLEIYAPDGKMLVKLVGRTDQDSALIRALGSTVEANTGYPDSSRSDIENLIIAAFKDVPVGIILSPGMIMDLLVGNAMVEVEPADRFRIDERLARITQGSPIPGINLEVSVFKDQLGPGSYTVKEVRLAGWGDKADWIKPHAQRVPQQRWHQRTVKVRVWRRDNETHLECIARGIEVAADVYRLKYGEDVTSWLPSKYAQGQQYYRSNTYREVPRHGSADVQLLIAFEEDDGNSLIVTLLRSNPVHRPTLKQVDVTWRPATLSHEVILTEELSTVDES